MSAEANKQAAIAAMRANGGKAFRRRIITGSGKHPMHTYAGSYPIHDQTLKALQRSGLVTREIVDGGALWRLVGD